MDQRNFIARTEEGSSVILTYLIPLATGLVVCLAGVSYWILQPIILPRLNTRLTDEDRAFFEEAFEDADLDVDAAYYMPFGRLGMWGTPVSADRTGSYLLFDRSLFDTDDPELLRASVQYGRALGGRNGRLVGVLFVAFVLFVFIYSAILLFLLLFDLLWSLVSPDYDQPSFFLQLIKDSVLLLVIVPFCKLLLELNIRRLLDARRVAREAVPGRDILSAYPEYFRIETIVDPPINPLFQYVSHVPPDNPVRAPSGDRYSPVDDN